MLRMPLHGQKERISWIFHSLDEMAGSAGGNLQAGGQVPDRLVMHAVYHQRGLAGDLGQHGIGINVYGVAGDRKVKGLVMGSRSVKIKLAVNILIDRAAKSDIEDLDSPADAEYRLFLLHNKRKDIHLQGSSGRGETSAFRVRLFSKEERMDVRPSRKEKAVQGVDQLL